LRWDVACRLLFGAALLDLAGTVPCGDDDREVGVVVPEPPEAEGVDPPWLAGVGEPECGPPVDRWSWLPL
jgi:hypothetical protein